jgi:FAD/FMN-containing dehydrogenase
MSPVLAALGKIFQDESILTEAADLIHYGKDRTDQYEPAPLAIVFPRCVEEVQQVVRLANQIGFRIVPSGGRTGLSGGACATRGEVVVSMERMNRIVDFDPLDRLVRCEAGVLTATLQSFAESKRLFFPIDLASAGSSQIGGNVATNAGGNRAVCYGMLRQWVRGLTVVSGAGEILYLGKGLKKNNTGYDLMQLFIGSEGTLGIICDATLELVSPPNIQVALLGLKAFDQVLELFQYCQEHLRILSFEYCSAAAIEQAQKEISSHFPLEAAAHYVLLEHDGLRRTLEDVLQQWYTRQPDTCAVLASSRRQAIDLKRWRECISTAIASAVPLKCDVAVRPSVLSAFFEDLEKLAEDFADWQLVLFGHIGDGNLHVNWLPGKESGHQQVVSHQRQLLQDRVYELVIKHGGAIAAEHGVGLLKKTFLTSSTDGSIVSLARQVADLLDPNGVLNPGKVYS